MRSKDICQEVRLFRPLGAMPSQFEDRIFFTIGALENREFVRSSLNMTELFSIGNLPDCKCVLRRVFATLHHLIGAGMHLIGECALWSIKMRL